MERSEPKTPNLEKVIESTDVILCPNKLCLHYGDVEKCYNPNYYKTECYIAWVDDFTVV